MFRPLADVAPPAYRWDLNLSFGMNTKRGKPLRFPQGKLTAKETDDREGKRRWRKQRAFCNETYRVKSLTTKVGPLPSGA